MVREKSSKRIKSMAYWSCRKGPCSEVSSLSRTTQSFCESFQVRNTDCLQRSAELRQPEHEGREEGCARSSAEVQRDVEKLQHRQATCDGGLALTVASQSCAFLPLRSVGFWWAVLLEHWKYTNQVVDAQKFGSDQRRVQRSTTGPQHEKAGQMRNAQGTPLDMDN